MKLKHVARRIVSRDGAAGFERHAGMPADRQFGRDHNVRCPERCVDIPITLANNGGFGGAARLELADLGVGPQNDR